MAAELTQIMFACHEDCTAFHKASTSKQTLIDMQKEFPRARCGKYYFQGTVSNAETTTLIINEASLADKTKDLVSNISKRVITFQRMSKIKKKASQCETPDGNGTIVSWSATQMTYTVKLNGSANEQKEYAPQQVDFLFDSTL